LSEVKTICDRILIINEGKLVADTKTDNLESEIKGKRKLDIKVDGPESQVLSTLKKIPGVSFVAVENSFGDGVSSYLIESQDDVDVRKPVFYAMAKAGWPIVSMDYLSGNIEDIFISVVDEDDEKKAAEAVEKSTKSDKK
jgi:ABC-2 type transport system ATP-binding protein